MIEQIKESKNEPEEKLWMIGEKIFFQNFAAINNVGYRWMSILSNYQLVIQNNKMNLWVN